MSQRPPPKSGKGARRSIVENRKARFEFEIMETFEAGIVLVGSEVKSLRGGRVFFTDAYAGFEGDELWLYNVNVAEYGPANQFNHKPARRRKLLMHRRELTRLYQRTREGGLSLVPLELYFLGSNIKVTLGLARGKKMHDKRDALKERDVKREIDRARKGDF